MSFTAAPPIKGDRDCCSRSIEIWLREAAAIARAGTSEVDRG
jgi:hypothetical protein